MVGADGFGAGAFAEEAGALAIELALKLGLPESEFGLKLGVERGEFGGLGFDELQAPGVGSGGVGDGGIQFLLLFGSQAGDGRAGFVLVLNDEFGLEGVIPVGAEVGDLLLKLDDVEADFFLGFEIGEADLLDVTGALVLDFGCDGVAEEEEDQGVGDGQAHENGDHETKGKLGQLAIPGEEGAVSGEEGAVDGKDDESPDGGDGVDDEGVVDEGREGVGAGDEGEGAGDQHGRSESGILSLLPVRALLESFGAGSGEPEEQAFEGVGHEREEITVQEGELFQGGPAGG